MLHKRVECVMCIYMEFTGLFFTGFTDNANSFFTVSSIPQAPVTMIFNDMKIEHNMLITRDFSLFLTLPFASTIVFNGLTLMNNSNHPTM